MEKEGETRGPRRIFTRRVIIVLVAWAVLTTLGSWRHQRRWIDETASDSWVGIDAALQVMVLPAWLGARTVGNGYGVAHSLAWTIGVNTLGFGALAAVYLVAQVGVRRLLSPSEPRASDSVDLSRRKLLLGAAPDAIAAVSGCGLLYATVVEPNWLHVSRVDVPIDGLALSHDGLRVLQISDTHRGPRISASFIAEAVRLGIAQKPDLILLTGDYVHMGIEFIEEGAALLAPLVSVAPTVGVLGNHDWYAGAHRVRHTLTKYGVRMIDNDRCFLTERRRLDADAGTLCIAGVGDLLEDHVNFDRALSGVDRSVPRLLMSHNPDAAELPELRSHRVDLMLSGHTHGGQVRLPIVGAPGVPSRYGQKYAQGLVDGPACRVHVSAGVGMSVAPLRFGVRPEINLLTLRSI